MKREIKIPGEIFYDKRLGHSERITLIALYSFSNPTTSIAKPSLRGLCLRAGFKSQSSIKTCLRNLEKLDWVKVTSKKGSSNQYKLTTQPIFEGGIEEGTSSSRESTLYTLNKLTNSNTHTQEHDEHEQQRSDHESKKPYFTGEKNIEEVQRTENETDPSHARPSRSLGRNPWDTFGELLRRSYYGSSDQGSDEDKSLSSTK